jgi:hypothetical protein
MPKKIFTQGEIEQYFKDVKHKFYDDTVKLASEMLVHADGTYPTMLLDERRPNESIEVQEYRKKIWQPKTKPTFNKVFNTIQKIRRSSDWSINYPNDTFTRVTEGEKLEDYCEKNYPLFKSLTNWLFTVYLRKYVTDANAVVVVTPLEWEVAENEYLKPVAQVFESKHVLDYMEEDYAVLLNPKGSVYNVNRSPVKGKSIFVVTTEEFLQYDQINAKGDFKLIEQTKHELGILPCFKTKGVLTSAAMWHFLYESRLSGMLPEMNEAVREYSDLQAAKVLHLYPERWEYTQNECRDCKGAGRRRNELWTEGSTYARELTCSTCNGVGYQVAGPYSKLIVKPVSVVEGGQQVPLPPVGYAEKDTEIIKVMEASVEAHIHNALSAINFDFINSVPMAQSGVAKSWDRDESNNTVHSIAEDLVRALDELYHIIAVYRYKNLYSEEDIRDMLPDIPVPERFDLLSTESLQAELKAAKEGKQNPILLNAMEVEFSSKRFNTVEEIRDRLVLCLTLDPLPNISEEDKMVRLTNKGISQETYIISSNIQEFTQRATLEDPKFPTLDIAVQKEKMKQYAQEMIAAQSLGAGIIDTEETPEEEMVMVTDEGEEDDNFGNPVE